MIISSVSSFAVESNDAGKYVPNGSRVLASKIKEINGRKFLFIKYWDEKTDRYGDKIIDNKGLEIKASELPQKKNSLISDELTAALSTMKNREEIKVNVALKNSLIEADIPQEFGEVEINGGEAIIKKNGEIINENEIKQDNEKKAAALARAREKRAANRKAIGEKLRSLNGWEKNEALLQQIEEGRPTLSLTLKKSEIQKLAATAGALIDGISVYVEPEEDIAGAMLDTRVDPHALNYSNRQGSNIGIFMSDSGCPNANHITNYTNLGGATSDHAENVSAIIRAVSPDSHIYCRRNILTPSSAELSGSNSNPQVHIMTMSLGWGATGNYETQDRDWDNLVYNNRILAFKSAGNRGNNDVVTSPGNGLNAIAVGNYNDASDTIATGSSGVDPANTKNEKPELSAPGTNITAGGHTMSGTSMAAPHAAGYAADLFSTYSWLQLKPAYSKAYMMASATKSILGSSEAVGVGGLNFYDAAYDGTNNWWEGGNSSFSNFASNDGGTDSSRIERDVYLTPSYGNVRIVFTWLNRGDYTFANRTASHPIGMDMDIRVTDPDGNYVTGSYSWDNPYEMVNFTPAKSGTYTVSIRRWANRDTSSKFHAGLSISW